MYMLSPYILITDVAYGCMREHFLIKNPCICNFFRVICQFFQICQKSSKKLTAIRLLEDVINNSRVVEPDPCITTQAQSNLLLKSLVDQIQLTNETRFIMIHFITGLPFCS